VGPWAGTIALEMFGGFALWSGMLVVGLLGAGVLSLLRDPRRSKAMAPETTDTALKPLTDSS
jgi:hypothetical protein